MEQQVLLFILFVGIGSTMVLDIWANIAPRLGWLPGTHWPSVGRWLRGLLSSHFVINGEDTSPTTVTESFLGWSFHYIIGIAYAAMFPLFWGVGFIYAPTVFPFFFNRCGCQYFGWSYDTYARYGRRIICT